MKLTTRQGHINREYGLWVEQQAQRYLEQCGLHTIERNFRCKLGEIDIIMLDGAQLVFVEVRFRRNPNFASAAASVDYYKQHKLRRCAEFFLLTQRRYAQHSCRFDVLAAQPGAAADRLDFRWIKQAFGH